MQNLIIYQFNTLFEIFKELDQSLNFKIIEAKNEKSLNKEINLSKTYLIATKKKISNFNNQLVFEKFPLKINKLIEKINVEFLKKQFNDQSKYNLKQYVIDLNSRTISLKNKKIKLTEKEIDTIIYLSKTNKTISIQELQKKVWGYQSNIETHTVETHIYRLRKKMKDIFGDEDFISNDDNGYSIK